MGFRRLERGSSRTCRRRYSRVLETYYGCAKTGAPQCHDRDGFDAIRRHTRWWILASTDDKLVINSLPSSYYLPGAATNQRTQVDRFALNCDTTIGMIDDEAVRERDAMG